MRTRLFIFLALAAVLISVPGSAAGQDNSLEPAHLVISVNNGSDALLNRMDWDVNAWAPLFPGTTVRTGDYIELSGRTTVIVMCTDLSLLEQRSSEVPRCDPYPGSTAFFYYDDPTWVPADNPDRIVVGSVDTSALPQDIGNPNDFNLVTLEGDALARVSDRTSTILSLDIPAEAQAFALASYYRSEDMLLDAISVLSAADIGCTEQRPRVESNGDRTIDQSPVVYLRLGEMYQMLGQRDAAERYYRCSADLATTLQDPANAALANARLANIAQDPGQATEFYQNAINNYMLLDAATDANAMLEICGSRNCTLPES
jgi:hypothetical protein